MIALKFQLISPYFQRTCSKIFFSLRLIIYFLSFSCSYNVSVLLYNL